MNILILGGATFADSSSDDEAGAGTDDPFKIVREIDPDHMKRSQLICTSGEELFMEKCTSLDYHLQLNFPFGKGEMFSIF